MLIGIVSDTHGYFHPALPAYLGDVDLILHAGDIGTAEVLDQLEAIGPTRAVWGNVDGSEIRRRVPEEQFFELDGISIRMIHIGGRPGRWAPGILNSLKARTPDVFICGHSHILRIDRVPSLGQMLFINPGAAGKQGLHRVKTCVRLEIENGQLKQAEVVHLDET